ncbi:MAG TPA: molybdate ABC transporter substrate-binding protein [Gaiella sp.]|nr:molybdate ABC transporter substrate-binding protein [Gaiella sp.]
MAALVGAAALLAGCAGGGDGDDRLVVFADPAVSGIAQALDGDASIVVASSSDLAERIREGSDADVFLAASEKPLDDLRSDGLVEKPTAFAANRLVIVVPRRNRAKVTHIVDLTREGVKIVLGAKGVPIGDLARQSLELAGLGAANDNVIGFEQGVPGLLDDVVSAKADAAIVYATDIDDEVGRKVQVYDISPYFQPEIHYDAAAVAPASDEATEYLARLNGDEGFEAVLTSGLQPALP